MKLVIATMIVAVGLATPAWAQSAADTLTQAAKQAAAEAVTDGINKAAGTSDKSKEHKVKKDKDGPNWGKSEDHRRDDDHGHKGKGKNKH
jgi:hypothetical protein